MHEFRVWAPRAGAGRASSLGRPPVPDGARAGAAGGRPRGRGRPGHRLRLRLDGGPPRPDPRSAFQPDGVARPVRGGRPRARSRWRDARLAGRAAAGVGPLRVPRRHLHAPRAPSTGPSRTSTIWSSSASTRSSCCRSPSSPATAGWGYDGVDLFAPHHAYGGPDGLKRLVDAAPRPRASAWSWTSCTTTSARPGTTCPSSGPYFSDRHHDQLGRRRQLRRPGQRRGPPLRHRQRPDVAARLPLSTGCASTPSTPSSTSPPSTSSSSSRPRWTRWPPTSGRPLFLIAESDLNDPRFVRSRRRRRLRPRRGLGRRVAPRPARRADRRARPATTRTSARWRCWPRPCARRGSTTASTPRTAGGRTAGRRPGWPAASSSSARRTTTRSATGPPATARPP